MRSKWAVGRARHRLRESVRRKKASENKNEGKKKRKMSFSRNQLLHFIFMCCFFLSLSCYFCVLAFALAFLLLCVLRNFQHSLISFRLSRPTTTTRARERDGRDEAHLHSYSRSTLGCRCLVVRCRQRVSLLYAAISTRRPAPSTCPF